MSKIEEIQPVEVWQIFNEILKTPRPSGHEEKIQNWAVSFGEKLGLETFKDETGNVIIRKPATPGMEGRKGVVIQGHLDMVPQKNNDKVHDFTKDPIDAFVDGDWVTANGTTLGADDGIGVSAALAVLASKNIKHGPVEVLLTSTEETGMVGANGLNAGLLKGDILINVDSETEGELYVGCAGGEDVTALFSYSEESVPEGYAGLTLNVGGMKGGHSGMDIDLGRGNANKVFFRVLNALYEKFEVRLSSVEGGSLRNAIPREVVATIAVKNDAIDEINQYVAQLETIIKNELAATEPGLEITVEKCDLPKVLIDEKTQVNLTLAVLACPNGVVRMSDSMEGMVETSTNLAIVKSDAQKNTICCAALMRSSVDSAKDYLGKCMEAAFKMAGADVEFTGAYGGWKPNMNSPILNVMQKVYENMFGKVPEIKAIHAGLECGILGEKYPHWDMISVGPTISSPHSPDEKVNIETVNKFWKFLVKTLENITEK